MTYMGTAISDALSVNEIYTILRAEITEPAEDCHPFPEIFYLSKGRVHLLINQVDYFPIGGQMIIYAPDFHHTLAKSPDVETEACVISMGVTSEILPALYNRIITLTEEQKRMLLTIIDEGCGCFRPRNPDDGFQGMVPDDHIEEHTLWRLKKQIEFFLTDVYETHVKETERPVKRETSRDRDFAHAVQFLHAHLSEVLTLEQIARECSMSVSKLKQIFREKAGCGPINYLIELRIEKAKQLIHASEMNVSEISDALGFASPHYFSRQFKKITGTSPREYAQKEEVCGIFL